MNRIKIIEIIGKEFHKSNIENGEWSYQKALDKKIKGHKFLDLRFVKNNVSVLVETKQNFVKKDESQLFRYVDLEKELTRNSIVAILANTKNDRIKVWKNDILQELDTKLKMMEEYIESFSVKKSNNKEQVMQATYNLNELLHKNGIHEELRSQFVGTCLLAIKKNLSYQGLTTKQILAGIKDILEELLESSNLNKAEKLTILDKKVLQHDDIINIEKNHLIDILDFIKDEIYPHIEDKTNEGQDLLNLFFTTFNKYVGKKDKNQAFTPDHIVHFMCKIAKVDRNSRVLDPTCGSGAFLVQAMVQAINNCRTEKEKENVKKNQIWGIEYEPKAFGLATTNMLIHGDGNTNVINADCFKKDEWIKDADIDIVLMNPPYNGQKKYLPRIFTDEWSKDTKTDPSKGLYFVHHTASIVKNGKLLCLLPLSCAIGNSDLIEEYKRLMLEENTLDAVFTLPNEMFYPGASVNACCMVFSLNKPHPRGFKTFFGYYKNDGFKKKKNLGRIDKGEWNLIQKEWLYLFENRIQKPGISVVKEISYKDEWLAEAYMETDYSNLKQENFQQAINDYLSYLVKRGSR